MAMMTVGDFFKGMADILQAGADECFRTPYNRDRCQRGDEYMAMSKKALELAGEEA